MRRMNHTYNSWKNIKPNILLLRVSYEMFSVKLNQLGTLKWKCDFDEIFVIGCIGNCQVDTFQSSKWWNAPIQYMYIPYVWLSFFLIRRVTQKGLPRRSSVMKHFISYCRGIDICTCRDTLVIECSFGALPCVCIYMWIYNSTGVCASKN